MRSSARSSCEMSWRDTRIPCSSTPTSSRRRTGQGHGARSPAATVWKPSKIASPKHRQDSRTDALSSRSMRGNCAPLSKAVHVVGNRERAELAVRVHDIALDIGEASLWAHALNRDDAWVLCGPDKASLRFGVRVGFRDRLVSLEGLLDDVGHRPKSSLRRAYTRQRHVRTLTELVFAEGSGAT